MAITDNLISFWELEEVSGTRADAVTASANNLTDNNTVTQQVPGKVGNAALFTAANSEWLSRASNSSLQLGGTSWTFGCWANVVSVGGGVQQTFIAKWDGGANTREYQLTINQTTTGKVDLSVSSDGTGGANVKTLSSTTSMVSGTTAFVVGTYDGSTLSLYLDAGTPVTVAWASGVFNGSTEFDLGRLGSSAAYLNGWLDQAFVYKRCLSAGEISTLYNGGAGLSYAALVALGASPFSQRDWTNPGRIRSSIKSDLPANLTTIRGVGGALPFSQTVWSIPASPPKKTNVLITRISTATAAPVSAPFKQSDWPNPYLRKDISQSDYSFPIYVYGSPFFQSDWTTAYRLPKPKIDDVVNLLTIRTIVAGAAPFFQSDWVRAPTRLKPKVDDVTNLLTIRPPLVSGSPFFQSEWSYPAFQPRKKDVLTIRISTAVAGPVAAAPFSQTDWPTPYLRKDVSQSDYSFPIYVSGSPFFQSDWTTAFRLPKTKIDDVINLLSIRTIVAGPAPFFQSDWLRAPIRLKSKVDDVVNLLTIRPPGVVAAPFSQTMWPNATLPPKDVSQADYSFPIYPVSAPFSQSDWTRILGVTRAKVDDVINRLPLQTTTVVVLPFSQTDWPRLSPAKQKSLAEPFGTLSSLLTPNPAQPFNQTDWTQNAAAKRKSQQADAVELLLPIYSPPVRPFVNLIGAETCVTRRQIVKSDILINRLPLTLTPAAVFPFVQSDWPRPVLNVNRWQAGAPQPSQKMPVPFVPPPPPPTTRRPLYLISGPSFWPGKT